MNVAVLLVLSLAALVILELFWIPRVKERLNRSRSMDDAIGLSAKLAGLAYLRGVLLVIVLTSATIFGLLFWLQNLGGIDVAAAEASLLKVQSWRSRLMGFGPFWGGLTLVSLVVALGVHARIRGRRRMAGVFVKVMEMRTRRLEEAMRSGQWGDSPQSRRSLKSSKTAL